MNFIKNMFWALALVLGLSFAMNAFAVETNTTTKKEEVKKPTTKKFDENLGFKINQNIAKGFCGENAQCSDFIALELEDAYKQGVAEKRDQRAWDLSIAKYARTKRNLCDNAPDKYMCYTYRNALLTRYMAGLSSKG